MTITWTAKSPTLYVAHPHPKWTFQYEITIPELWVMPADAPPFRIEASADHIRETAEKVWSAICALADECADAPRRPQTREEHIDAAAPLSLSSKPYRPTLLPHTEGDTTYYHSMTTGCTFRRVAFEDDQGYKWAPKAKIYWQNGTFTTLTTICDIQPLLKWCQACVIKP